MRHKVIFKQRLPGFISEFSFSKTGWHAKVKWSRLPYYLPIAGGTIVGFIPFSRVLTLCEMQTVLFRIECGSPRPFPWTISIIPGMPIYIYIYIYIHENRHKTDVIYSSVKCILQPLIYVLLVHGIYIRENRCQFEVIYMLDIFCYLKWMFYFKPY